MTTPDKAMIARRAKIEREVSQFPCTICHDEGSAECDCKPGMSIRALQGANQLLKKQLADDQARLTALLAENEALRAEVERKDAALRLARDSHGKLLLTDPPQGALKRENEALREALLFTLICAENGHDATANTRAALSPARKGEA